jgi:dipeptidyl aminopeptidase/acylaminoacyl peptidase
MGPVRDPGQYRCAVSTFGVTDLMLLFTSFDSDASEDWKSYGARLTVGDPDTEREKLKTYSPVHRVADMKVPVLLVAGLKDVRVPREHADDFESAARKAGVKLERVDYPDEAHGFFVVKDHVDFLKRLDAFMARSIGREPK